MAQLGLLMKFVLLCFINYGICDSTLCGNDSPIKTRSCSTQILGQEHRDSCQVESLPSNSVVCKDMKFSPIVPNTHIGGVSLTPNKITHFTMNQSLNFNKYLTVLNITFSKIKWKTMRFRFQRVKNSLVNHCSNIIISHNVTLNDQSVLYYDCYWSESDSSGQSYILDFEATNNKIVNRGQYFFNIPSDIMFAPNVEIDDWIPFTYIEIISISSDMMLHIMPPPQHLKVKAYNIQVKKECEQGTQQCNPKVIQNTTLKIRNLTDEVTYKHSLLSTSGSYFFVVMPIHDDCDLTSSCQQVESPRITIKTETHSLNICIASVAALVVSILFAYYIMLRVLRRYCMTDVNGKDYTLTWNGISAPKIMVIYPNENQLHAECVTSFVAYLRAQYGFDVMYEGDIGKTPHGNPVIWAQETFKDCTHIIYIVGPSDHNIHNQPIISAYVKVDNVQLNLLSVNLGTKNPKPVINVFFKYSNGPIPIETSHGKEFHLLKDWEKMIAFLSNNMLAKQQMLKTDKGRRLLEDIERALKTFRKNDNIVLTCEKKSNGFDKKVLL